MAGESRTAHRTVVSLGLVLGLVAVVVAVLVHRSTSSEAADTGCGPLPAVPGGAVNGVTAALTSVPATVTTARLFQATMLLSADPASSVESTDSAYLLLVDERGNVVGSGNFAFLAMGQTVRPVGADGLVMHASGEPFRCVDIDEPTADTQEPLAAGDYRVAGVLYTGAGYLVTPLRPISVD